MHKDFIEVIQTELQISKTNLVFAPHHGRRTGRIPKSLLQRLSPEIIVIGEGATEHLDYYAGYNTITQNSAGDVIFECLQISEVTVQTQLPGVAIGLHHLRLAR
jgi:hypothetical protein